MAQQAGAVEPTTLLCGLHVDSTWTLQYFLVESLLDSLWTPHGLCDIFYTEFTRVPMDSI